MKTFGQHEKLVFILRLHLTWFLLCIIIYKQYVFKDQVSIRLWKRHLNVKIMEMLNILLMINLKISNFKCDRASLIFSYVILCVFLVNCLISHTKGIINKFLKISGQQLYFLSFMSIAYHIWQHCINWSLRSHPPELCR